MKCPECGTEFTPLSVTQKYCSRKCGHRYREKNKGKIQYPSITFQCSWCGRTITTEEGSRDMRSKFCNVNCEKGSGDTLTGKAQSTELVFTA